MGTASGIRLVPVGVLVQRKGMEAVMGMFRRREDSEAAGLRAEVESLQGRLSSDVATLDAGDSLSDPPGSRGHHTVHVLPSHSSHPPPHRDRSARGQQPLQSSTREPIRGGGDLDSADTQHRRPTPRKPPVVCRTPPFAGTAHTTARPTDARDLDCPRPSGHTPIGAQSPDNRSTAAAARSDRLRFGGTT